MRKGAKPMATEDKLWLPPSSPTAQVKLDRGRKKAERNRLVAGIASVISERNRLVAGIAFLIFVGVIVPICLLFIFNWPLWILIPLMLIEVALLILLIRVGYTAQWTGFGEYTSPSDAEKSDFQRSKTLWDWLNLFAILLIPLVVVGATIGFGGWQQYLATIQHHNDVKIAQDNRQNDLNIALDQEQEATLTSYLNDMSDLLLNNNLANSKPGDAVSELARERTLITLRRLGPGRNMILLQFLQDAHLIGVKNAVIDLSHVDLSYDKLSGANLSGADLRGTNLNDTQLSGADLSYANLSCIEPASGTNVCANLSGANLSGANLLYTNLSGANLSGANLSCIEPASGEKDCTNLSDANLSFASLGCIELTSGTNVCTNLSDAVLFNADLSGANLSCIELASGEKDCTNLSGAHLLDADLSFANLSGANLSGADLRVTNLNDTQLSCIELASGTNICTNLSDANLSFANLSRATVTNDQLAQAKSLQGATMPNGSRHP
jgi:uncharacterized protein YjbI with pentapeptide repeats